MGESLREVMTKTAMSAVKNFSELSGILSKLEISGVYLFIGNGAKLQYGNMEQVRSSLKPVLTNISNLHGGNRGWMAVYGGDTYDPANPDLGSCMHYVKSQSRDGLRSTILLTLSFNTRRRGIRRDRSCTAECWRTTPCWEELPSTSARTSGPSCLAWSTSAPGGGLEPESWTTPDMSVSTSLMFLPQTPRENINS